MTNYKTGTVAKATVRGQRDVLVVRTGDCWHTPEAVGLWHTHLDGGVTDIRPLVVLDVDGDNCAHALRKVASAASVYGVEVEADVARDIADQIEDQTKPARIPEPGAWGVVEARQRGDANIRKWVRHSSGLWFCSALAIAVDWDDLIDPVLVREGVDV